MEAWLAEILAPCPIQPDTHSAASAGRITLETSWAQHKLVKHCAWCFVMVLLADHPNKRTIGNVVLLFNGPRDICSALNESCLTSNSNMTCVKLDLTDIKVGCRRTPEMT